MKNYTMDDGFTVKEDVNLISGRIADHLGAVGLRPNQTRNGIEVRAGSDILFRLLGIPLGSRSFPVGLDVLVSLDEGGTRVTSSAYDRLGWYVTKKLFWGEDVLNRKFTDLLNEVRVAAGQPKLLQQTATFSPTQADDIMSRLMKPIDSIWRLLFACVLVFALSFGLSLVAIWLLPAGEVIGNILRGIAAVISALLILAFVNRRTSPNPGEPQK